MSAGIHPGQTRASGSTVAVEVGSEVSEELLADIEEASLDTERQRVFSSLSFSRMRTTWRPEEAAAISRMHEAVDQAMEDRFPDAYELMYDVYNEVREVEADEDGEVQVDAHGLPLWKRTAGGGYVEDWSRLTLRYREDLIYRITTRIFAWQQDAADLWGEAMMAKALWQESFSHHFESEQGRSTVDARTARGNVGSAEDRYYAVYVSLLSKKADALVRSMELLGQRLKDTMD